MGDSIREMTVGRLRAVVRDAFARGETYNVQRLKRDFNTLLPIHKLPMEILAAIFMIWASQCRDAQWDLVGARRGRGYHRWITITHVCHLWREVALSFATLWCDFAVTGDEVTDVMLSRSKQAPLDVKIYHATALQEPIQLVLDHIHRIQSLTFSRELHSHTYAIGSSAPYLRTLAYENCLTRGNEGDRDELTGAAATPFDRVDMPALTVLDLRNSGALWSSPLLKPTLTSLTFSESGPGAARFNSSMSDVLRMLMATPMLTMLSLFEVLPPAPDSSAPPPSCHLPHLDKLSLGGPASSAIGLLEHLIFPPTARIAVHCSDTDDDALVPLLRALSPRSADTTQPAPPLACLCLSGAVLGAWPADPGPWVLGASNARITFGGTPLRAVAQWRACTPLPSFLQHFGALAPLAGITTLYVDPPAPLRWAPAALAGMPHLRTLGVGRHGLALLCARRRGAARGVPVFPRLESLILRFVWMRRRPHGAARSRALRRLIAALDARAAAGYRLRCVSLYDCVNVVPEDAMLLRRMVDNLNWDGAQWLATGGARDMQRGHGGVEGDPVTMVRVVSDAGSGTSDSSDASDEEDDDTDTDAGNEDENW